MTELLWVTVHVSDLDTSVEFYKELFGLNEVRRFSPTEGLEISFLKAGDRFMIELISDGENVFSGKHISMGIKPEREPTVYAKAKEMGILKGGIMDLGPSMECYFITDPDGFMLQIVREKVLH